MSETPYTGDWKDTFVAREGSLYGYPGDSGQDPDLHIGLGYHYASAGSVDVVPEDLSGFAEFLKGDIEAFQTARGEAVDEFFDRVPFPRFEGGTIDAFVNDQGGGGVMPEGAAYSRKYIEAEIQMRILLNQVEMGMLALQLAATFIHQDYLAADFLDAGNPFAAYGSGVPVSAFFTMGSVESDQRFTEVIDPGNEHHDQLGEWGVDEEAIDRFEEQVAETAHMEGVTGHDYADESAAITPGVLNQGLDSEHELDYDYYTDRTWDNRAHDVHVEHGGDEVDIYSAAPYQMERPLPPHTLHEEPE